MKEIQLTNGGVALVDDEDFAALNEFSWLEIKHPDGLKYAGRYQGRVKDGTFEVILMHREILNPDDSALVDHRDGNGLNNTRKNLRCCTHTQNMQNRRPNRRSHTQFKGIYFEANKNLWRARIGVSGKQIKLGRYKSEIDAAKAYDAAAKQYFGEFARLNFA